MNEKQLEQIKQIADYYGKQRQINKAMEECGELVQMLAKYNSILMGDMLVDQKETTINITEELADVLVCIKQIAYLLKIEDPVKGFIDYKITRQLDRIEDEKLYKQNRSGQGEL